MAMQTTKAAAKAAAFLKQKKYREEQGEFLAEGLRTVEEAVEYGQVSWLFYVENDDARLQKLLKKAEEKGISMSDTFAGYMAQIADTVTPQGVIAVCKIPQTTLDDLAKIDKMFMVLDRIQDPGNMGTIIRTADAAGVSGIITMAGSVDVYSPKVVRASMGSVFHIPIVEGVTEAQLKSFCKEHNYIMVVTAMEGGQNVFAYVPRRRMLVVVGNEANGVSPTLLEAADKRLFIPMRGRAESLNVAIAAGIIMFKLTRDYTR